MDHNLRIQPGESSANSPPSRRNVGKLSPLHPESTWSHHLKITSRNYNHSDLPPPQQKSLVDVFEFFNEDGFGSGVCVGGMIRVRVIRVRVV